MNRTFARLATALATVMVASISMVAGLAATAQAAPIAQAPAPTPSEDYRAVPSATYEARVLRSINQRRARHNLPRVRLDSCADRLAERWSAYLAANSLFKHQDLSPFYTRCDATYAAETIARGPVLPRRLVSLWMDSRTHRAIILNRSPRFVGVAAVLDSRGSWVVTADFMRR